MDFVRNIEHGYDIFLDPDQEAVLQPFVNERLTRPIEGRHLRFLAVRFSMIVENSETLLDLGRARAELHQNTLITFEIRRQLGIAQRALRDIEESRADIVPSQAPAVITSLYADVFEEPPFDPNAG